jgi:hypothetical protein
LRRADHPSKESYHLSVDSQVKTHDIARYKRTIKKVRRLNEFSQPLTVYAVNGIRSTEMHMLDLFVAYFRLTSEVRIAIG